MQSSVLNDVPLAVLACDQLVGLGIPHDAQARVFERFFRASNAESSYVTGMGVGLSISRTIVEAHGGRIWAEPARNGGAVFHFTLRLANKEETGDGR